MADVTRALILAATPADLTAVAGVPLAVRAVLVLERAGFEAIGLVAGAQEPSVRAALARRGAEARVVWVRSAGDAGALAAGGPVLVVAGHLLFDPAALAPLLAAGAEGRQVVRGAGPGSGVRLAVCPAVRLPALVAELDEGRRGLGEALARVRGLDGPAVPPAPGLCMGADPPLGPRRLETALLDDLARRTAAKDSYLAALVDRRLSRPVTRWLLGWPVTPSQVTVASLALGLVGAAGLATVSYGARVAGVLALVASIVLDCVDGELARARLQQSAAGARLDLVGDYVVHLAVFTGLGVGLWRQGLPPAGAWAAVALVAAVATTTVTLHRLFVRPALEQGDLHWAGGDAPAPALATVVEKVASRDYTYLLLVLALLGRLQWFLYAAAVGAWGFVAVVVGYRAYQRRAPARSVATTP